MVVTLSVSLKTQGNTDIIDVTQLIQEKLYSCNIQSGLVNIFSPSATSSITTIEYEEGCLQDLRRLFDEIVSSERVYAHNQCWGDGNGHSHVRAALLGPSLTVPFLDKKLLLGTWQQIIFIDFDNRPRQRQLALQILGD